MNEEVREILDRLNIPMNKSCACCLEDYECKLLYNYITNLKLRLEKGIELVKEYRKENKKLTEENERLNTELNAYKDEFCKDTIKEYELVMEKEYYKSRCERTIEFCDYLLAHDEVVINRKKYIKQNGDDIITNAIKSKLLGGDE